jgi:carbon storage regulator
MLILTRKRGESLIINDDIEIKVLHIYRGSVKIGIYAPQKIAVDRKEAHERKKKEIMTTPTLVD